MSNSFGTSHPPPQNGGRLRWRLQHSDCSIIFEPPRYLLVKRTCTSPGCVPQVILTGVAREVKKDVGKGVVQVFLGRDFVPIIYSVTRGPALRDLREAKDRVMLKQIHPIWDVGLDAAAFIRDERRGIWHDSLRRKF